MEMKIFRHTLILLFISFVAVTLCSGCDKDVVEVKGSYYVLFDTGAGSVVEEQIVEYMGVVSRPDDPVLVGSDFVDWYSDAEFSQIWDFTTVVTSDITLYARWTVIYYAIATKSDLIAFREAVNGGESDLDAKLICDIDLEDEEWIAIGYDFSSPYSGEFDGDGFSIEGLNISGEELYQGLFGYVDSATISDLKLVEPLVNGGEYTGAICGRMQQSNIINCCVEGGSVSGELYTGGIVGMVSSVGDSIAKVNGCYNSAELSGSGDYIGGVIGYIDTYAAVESCYNEGAISGDTSIVGGVVGLAMSIDISNCYNLADISFDGYVGGVVGTLGWLSDGAASRSSSVEECYNRGSITTDDDGICAGGVVGTVENGNSVEIVRCYNSGSVEASTLVGGVVGYSYTYDSSSFLLANSYNTGELFSMSVAGGVISDQYAIQASTSSIVGCYNMSSTKAMFYAGGVVRLAVADEESQVSICGCYSAGDLEAGYYIAGGVANVVSNTTIAGCYYSSDATYGIASTESNEGCTSVASIADLNTTSVVEGLNQSIADSGVAVPYGYVVGESYPVFE